MIAERFAGHSGVKYLRSLGCERVQFKNQVCNPELRGLPAKSETLRLNSGVSWPAHGKRCRTAGFYSSVLSAESRFRSGLVIVSSGLLRGRRVQALMDIRVVILIRSHQLERRGLVCCHCSHVEHQKECRQFEKPTHGLAHRRVSIARYRTRAVGRVKAPKPDLLKPTAPATAPPANETTGGQKRRIRARIAAESTVAPPARSTAPIIS